MLLNMVEATLKMVGKRRTRAGFPWVVHVGLISPKGS